MDEPWKKTAQIYGSTHPSRKDKLKQALSGKDSNDGRPPDSNDTLSAAAKISAAADKEKLKAEKNKQKQAAIAMKRQAAAEKKAAALAKKEAMKAGGTPFQYMLKALHYDGFRLYRDGSYQSYPWNGTASCWLDSSLEALFFCFIHCPESFHDAFQALGEELKSIRKGPGSVLVLGPSEIVWHMEQRLAAYGKCNLTSELQQELYDLRDGFAAVSDLDSLDKYSNPLVCTYIIADITHFRIGSKFGLLRL